MSQHLKKATVKSDVLHSCICTLQHGSTLPVSMSKLFLTVLLRSILMLLSPNSLFQFTVGMDTFKTAESAFSTCRRDLLTKV